MGLASDELSLMTVCPTPSIPDDWKSAWGGTCAFTFLIVSPDVPTWGLPLLRLNRATLLRWDHHTARTVALWRSGLWAVTGKKDGGISPCRAVCISVLPRASVIAATSSQSEVAAYAFKHDGAWEIMCIPRQSLALISVFICPLP